MSIVHHLFLALIVGALMDRWRRQRTLAITTVGLALLFATMPVLLMTETLTFRSLAAVTSRAHFSENLNR